jgi:hypothetical protein
MKKITATLDRLGEWTTLIVGTMWCALLFGVIAVCATPGVFPAPVTAVFQWFAQDFLQLVLLPVIMVGTAVEARKAHLRELAAEERADEMYRWSREQHDALHKKIDALHDRADE